MIQLQIFKSNGQITKEGSFSSFEEANFRALELNRLGYEVEILDKKDMLAECLFTNKCTSASSNFVIEHIDLRIASTKDSELIEYLKLFRKNYSHA